MRGNQEGLEVPSDQDVYLALEKERASDSSLEEGSSEKAWQSQWSTGRIKPMWPIRGIPHLPGVTYLSATLSMGWESHWEGQPWCERGEGFQSAVAGAIAVTCPSVRALRSMV